MFLDLMNLLLNLLKQVSLTSLLNHELKKSQLVKFGGPN
jgi:hypothetical protein